MSKRSPVLGYNHNFKHRGLIFHVQTEDSGVDNPHLFTHLFHGGVIISSRRVDYDAASDEDIVKGLMQSQHKAVLKDLKIGTFDDKIDAYLGTNKDLLPRKTGPMATPEPPAPEPPAPEPLASAADVPLVPATEPTTPAPTDVMTSAPALRPTELRSPALTPVPDAAHSGAIPLNTPSTAIPQIPPADTVATTRVPAIPDTAEHQAPPAQSTKQRHEREPIPTPIAVPVVSEDDLGDPVVTFNQSSPKVDPPVDSVGERSATYSIQRPQQRRRAATQARSVPDAQPRVPARPERAMGSRASGKSANPQPGMRRSSVVVSRPAVIIGAPARAVGGDSARRSKRRTPPARKTRNKDLFGNDTISEKSLDEVIMAYLSEDNNDD